ncbi:MAG: hypothetical protein ACOY3Z_05715 [Thermodesulfobacteriota bacterium]
MRNMQRAVGLLVAALILASGAEAFAFLGFGGSENWKEEVQLSDGLVIVVERETLRERGGDEWVMNRSGTKPKEYLIRFAHPDRQEEMIEWRSTKSYRTWPEVPLVLDLSESRQPVVYTSVGINAGCEVYSKYVYSNGVWREEMLPETFEKRITNLYLRIGVNMPWHVDLETKRKGNAEIGYPTCYRQVGPTRKVCGD